MEKKEVIIKYAILTAVYVAFLALFWPFKTALLLAALFAMAAAPILNRGLKICPREKLLVFILVFGLLLTVIVPLTVIVIKGILNLSQLQQETISQLPVYQNIQNTLNTIWNSLNNFALRFDFDLSEDFDIQSILPRALQTIVPWLTVMVTRLPEFLLELFVFIASLYFFLLHRMTISQWVEDRKILSTTSLHKLIELLQKICYTVVFSTIVVAAIQAAIITIAASLAGFGNLMMIFILSYFFAFLPVVGSVPVSISLALYSFLQGQSSDGVIMLIGLGIAGGIDNVIRVYILSAEEGGIHPMISLLTLIGALAMFGMPGLFLGPIIAELAFVIGKIMNSEAALRELSEPSVQESEPEPPHSP